MKRFTRIAIVVIIALSFFGASCARVPTEKKSARIIQNYFKKYGKKYRDTIYGQSKVKEVDVTGQQEIHKHLVAVEAFITLEDGTVQRVQTTIEKGPLGNWRFISWENATGM